jgi:hypothetical protein
MVGDGRALEEVARPLAARPAGGAPKAADSGMLDVTSDLLEQLDPDQNLSHFES